MYPASANNTRFFSAHGARSKENYRRLLLHGDACFHFRRADQFPLRVGARLRILRLFWFCGDLPEAGRWHDELNSHLRLAHKALAYTGDAAQQFFPDVGVLDAYDLIHFDGSGHQDQRAVIVHDNRFGFFRQGLLARVAQPHDYGNA